MSSKLGKHDTLYKQHIEDQLRKQYGCPRGLERRAERSITRFMGGETRIAYWREQGRRAEARRLARISAKRFFGSLPGEAT